MAHKCPYIQILVAFVPRPLPPPKTRTPSAPCGRSPVARSDTIFHSPLRSPRSGNSSPPHNRRPRSFARARASWAHTSHLPSRMRRNAISPPAYFSDHPAAHRCTRNPCRAVRSSAQSCSKIVPRPVSLPIWAHMPHIRDPSRLKRRDCDAHLLRFIQTPLRLQRHINIHAALHRCDHLPGIDHNDEARLRPQFARTPRQPFAEQILKRLLDFPHRAILHHRMVAAGNGLQPHRLLRLIFLSHRDARS